jgi:hypothetical protein
MRMPYHAVHDSGVPSSGIMLKFHQNISTGTKLKIYEQMDGQLYCHAHYVNSMLMEGKHSCGDRLSAF